MDKEILYILLDNYAEHEIGFMPGAVSTDATGFRKEPKYMNKMVAPTMEPVKSLGGMQTLPDYSFETMPADYTALVLIGGFGWMNPEAERVLPIVKDALGKGVAYDIFKHERLVELAPYVSAYAGALEGIKKFRVDCGLVFNVYSSLMWPEEMVDAEETSHLRGELISAKIGVRLNDLKPQFYFDFGMNLIALGMILCPDNPKDYEPCSYP